MVVQFKQSICENELLLSSATYGRKLILCFSFFLLSSLNGLIGSKNLFNCIVDRLKLY